MNGFPKPEFAETGTAKSGAAEADPGESEPTARGPRPRLLPPLELEVMKALWAEGESSVAEVQAALHNAKPLAYTTVMTLLERLTRKGAVTRRKQGRGFRYTPVFTREAMTELAVERLVEDFFDSSREGLAAYLGGLPAMPTPSLQHEAEPESIDSVLL